MLLCIAGKNDIAVNVLEYVLGKYPYIDVVGIPVKNDSGENGFQRSFRKFLRKRGILEVTLEDIYDRTDLIFLSLEFDQIIAPQKFRSQRLFNIHFSLLPKYRGMYTSAIPILNNELESGVTLHYIDHGIDTGDIIGQKAFSIDFTDTARDLYRKYIYHGTELVKGSLEKLIDLPAVPSVPQDYRKATYYSKKSINYKNLEVDLNQCAVSIYNQIRAFNFREYQIPRIKGIPIVAAEITNTRSTEKPGVISRRDEYSLTLTTIDYDLILFEDKFDELTKAIETCNIHYIEKIPKIECYTNDVGETDSLFLKKFCKRPN